MTPEPALHCPSFHTIPTPRVAEQCDVNIQSINLPTGLAPPHLLNPSSEGSQSESIITLPASNDQHRPTNHRHATKQNEKPHFRQAPHPSYHDKGLRTVLQSGRPKDNVYPTSIDDEPRNFPRDRWPGPSWPMPLDVSDDSTPLASGPLPSRQDNIVN
ncbi:hypothetical protein TNCV_3543911 [Trichonephila clavipes]|nr:hypothetical protein TNCV_3543911 [Trichonephila clavipes]